ncbi:MAG: hypothetical protein LC772_04515 [Chloroflexi bacterium]|nr:hypothetical protein [Chloroflexota bacterium]
MESVNSAANSQVGKKENRTDSRPVLYPVSQNAAPEAADAPETSLLVWRPDLWRLRLSLLSWCVSCAVWLYLCVAVPRLPLYWYILTTLMFLVYLSSVLETLRRPRYLTADEDELSIAVWRASCAVRWADIDSMELRHQTLRLSVPETLFFNLAGYPHRTRDALIAHILEKASLRPDPARKGVYLKLKDASVSPSVR